MKPVRLVMSAFGSYGGLQKIEFGQMQNGIFLIAGDTGSGKSTIFDAVMFALYDTMSGKERKSIMMRSEYAPEDMETFVEFTFSYEGMDGGIYTIKRYPAYERKSKRRNKDGKYNIIRQNSKAELTMPDGTQFNGKNTQINKKIEEITGLTAEQFSKIALIAQGEFTELIMDKTGRRKEIFQQIFSTQLYGNIEDVISSRYKAEAMRMKDNSIKLDEISASVDLWEDSPYKERWEEAYNKKDTEPEGIINILQEEHLRLEEIYNGKYSLYLENEKKFNDLNNFITKGKKENKLLAGLEELEMRKKSLASLKEEMDNKETVYTLARKAAEVSFTERNYNNRKREYSNALKKSEELALMEKGLKEQYKKVSLDYSKAEKEYKKLMPGYAARRESLKSAVLKYKELADKEKVLTGLNNNIQAARAGVEKETAELGRLKEESVILEDIIKSYEGLGLEASQAEMEQKKCDGQWQVLCKLKKRKETCTDKTEALYLLEKNLLGCISRWEESRRRHEEYNRAYIACQSAFLAEGLMPGVPCPVCGSADHPHTACMPDNAVTADMLKKAGAEEKRCGKEKDSIQEKTETERSALMAEIAVLNEYISQLGGDLKEQKTEDRGINFLRETIKDTEAFIKEKEAFITSWRKDISEKINTINKKATDKEEKLEKLAGLGRKQEKLLSDINKHEKEIHQSELKAGGMEKEIEAFKTSLGYDTREEAEKHLEECEAQLKVLEEMYMNSDRAFKDIQKKLTSVQGSVKEAARQVNEYSQSLEELIKTFERTFKENGFKSASEYRSAILDTKVIKEMEESIAFYKEQCVKVDAGIQTIKEQSDSTEKIDIDTPLKMLEDIKNSMAVIKKELGKYNFCIQSNNKLIERISVLMQERRVIAGKLRVIKSLNDAANGKVHFQTYIQRQYFKQIIQAANARLSKMAPGRFLLKCRDIRTGGQGETGLELDVYNPVTGKSRDAHTLSGGETFMASLSMALGMADTIQNTIGRTRLGTMFIDEGFGSLSDDARDQAVKVLLELAGGSRLIGVISHVSELKEQIPKKLIVTKGNNGSIARWED